MHDNEWDGIQALDWIYDQVGDFITAGCVHCGFSWRYGGLGITAEQAYFAEQMHYGRHSKLVHDEKDILDTGYFTAEDWDAFHPNFPAIHQIDPEPTVV